MQGVLRTPCPSFAALRGFAGHLVRGPVVALDQHHPGENSGPRHLRLVERARPALLLVDVALAHEGLQEPLLLEEHAQAPELLQRGDRHPEAHDDEADAVQTVGDGHGLQASQPNRDMGRVNMGRVKHMFLFDFKMKCLLSAVCYLCVAFVGSGDVLLIIFAAPTSTLPVSLLKQASEEGVDRADGADHEAEPEQGDLSAPA